MTPYKDDTHQWLHFHLQSTHNKQSLPLNAITLIFLYKNKIFPISHLQCQLCLLDCLLLQHTFFKMENPLFSPCLDELISLWNNAVCQMNYWVCAAGIYRSTGSFFYLEKVHKAFFNYYQLHAMAYMPDEIILARMMTALDLQFEGALHYYDEGYDSNNNYGLILRSRHSSTQLLLGECSRFNGFHKQKTEAPVELTIYIFTYLLLDYIQNYIQYFHIVALLLI